MGKIDLDLSHATRLLESGPVTLVTAKHKGTANVMAAAWITPISNDPPMIALAVYPARYTHDLIQKGGSFTVNVPPRALAERVRQVGERSGEDADKFLTIGLTPFEGRQVTAPLIEECIGHLECALVDTLRTGNHTLFLGEVVAAAVDDNAFNGEMWTLTDESRKPLHHLGANIYAVLDEPLAI